MSTFGSLTAPIPFASVDTGSVEVGSIVVPGSLGALFSDEGPLGLDSLSLTFPSERETEQSPFANPSVDRDLKNSHVRNGRPTSPPYYEGKSFLATSNLNASFLDPPVTTPPKVQGQGRYKSHNEDEAEGKGEYGNGTITKCRTSHEAKSKASNHQHARLTKREKSLERNRLAASKCRQKKKEHTLSLELRFKEQLERKSQLESQLASLRCQILDVKNEVLKHAHCGNGHVGQHLAQMMKQIMRRDNPIVPESTDTIQAVSPSAKSPTLPALHEPQLPEVWSSNLDDTIPVHPSANAEFLQNGMRWESEALPASEVSHMLSDDDNFD